MGRGLSTQTMPLCKNVGSAAGKSARISNYVTYKEKSARREAAQHVGASGKLPRGFKYEDLDIDKEEAMRIERKLLGKKRAISKHCGGSTYIQTQDAKKSSEWR